MKVQKFASENLEFIEFIMDTATKKYQATIRFSDSFDPMKKITLNVDRSDLTQPDVIQKLILDAGGPIFPDVDSALAKILENKSPQISYIVQKSGWHEDDFVTLYGDFPAEQESTGKRHSLNNKTPLYKGRTEQGELASFIKGLQKPLKHSSPLRFAFLASLAPAMADRLGYTGCTTVTLSGPPSREKSLILRTAMSVYSRANAEDMPSLAAPGYQQQKHQHLIGGLCIPFDCQTNENSASYKVRKYILSLIQNNNSHSGSQTDIDDLKYSIQMFGIDAPDNINTLQQRSSQKMSTCFIDLTIPDETALLIAQGNRSINEVFELLEYTITTNYGVLISEWIKIIQTEEMADLQKIADFSKEAFITCLTEEVTEQGINKEQLNAYAEFYTAMYISAFYFNRKLNNSFNYLTASKEILNVTIENIKNNYSYEFKSEKLFQEKVSVLIKQAHLLPLINTGEKADKNNCANGFQRDDLAGRRYLYIDRDHLNKIIGSQRYVSKELLPSLVKKGALIKPKTGYTRSVEQAGLERIRYCKLDIEKLNDCSR